MRPRLLPRRSPCDFSQNRSTRGSAATGKRLPSDSAPAIGDRLSLAGNDYVGNHEHHAKQATASDHVVCTLTSPRSGLCDGTIAIDGSMIFGDDDAFVLGLNSKVTTLKITGGTGPYRHAHGTVVATTVGNYTDLTAEVTS